MSKRGKLSKVELSYIETNHDKLSVGDLAKDLDRTQDIVKQAIKNLNLETKESTTHIDTVTKGPIAGDLVGKHVRNNRVVATVMTEAASERADAHRKNPVVTRHTEDAVHKPLGKGSFDRDGRFKKAD